MVADATYRIVPLRSRHIVYSLTTVPQSSLRQELISQALGFLDFLRWPRRVPIGHIIERITSSTTSTLTTTITGGTVCTGTAAATTTTTSTSSSLRGSSSS